MSARARTSVAAELAAAGAPAVTTGGLLRATFSAWTENVAIVTAVGCVAYAPFVAVSALPAFGIAMPLPAQLVQLFSTAFVETLAGAVVAARIAVAGRVAGPGALLGSAVRRAPALVGVALLRAAAVLLGFALLVLPGVWARLALVAAGPAVALEGAGPYQACRRSAALARGHLGKIFLALLAVSLLGSALGAFAGAALRLLGAAWGGWATWGAFHLVNAFAAGPAAVLCVIAYRDLRRLAEGPPEDPLARVFE